MTLTDVYDDIDTEEHDIIRTSCRTGTPLGNDCFKKKVEDKLKCKIGQTMRALPLKGFAPYS
jgi:hemerythrin superfamily protein